eukprot:2780340-Lingulodinium_polyedra.AAC.1
MYAQKLPASWTMKHIRSIAPSISPFLFQCYCCLLHAAMAMPGSEDLMNPAGARAFERARA